MLDNEDGCTKSPQMKKEKKEKLVRRASPSSTSSDKLHTTNHGKEKQGNEKEW